MSQFLISNDSTSDQLLRYRLEGPKNYLVGQSVNIVFTLENESHSPLWVLTWYTPLEGLKGKILRVVCDNKEIPYEGPMVKRGKPNLDDYILIKPGKSVSAEVNLSLAYNLPLAQKCQIEFQGKIYDVVLNESLISPGEGTERSMNIQGNILTLEL